MSNPVLPSDSSPGYNSTTKTHRVLGLAEENSAEANTHGEDETSPLLSPDDPRVTPLNISSVVLFRFCLHVLLIFNVIWLILSLISYFVSVPGFDSHGKSYLEFSFIFIGLYVNLLSYTFFLTPSDLTSDRYINVTSLALLLFDLFLLLVVPYQRSQVGLSEYIALLFATLTVGINYYSNIFVMRAKTQEEVRLTGRPETRKTLNEHVVIGLEFFLKFLLVLYVLAITLNILLRSVDVVVSKPWGELVPTVDDQYRIHLYCEGDVYGNSSSQPIILLESGHESSEEFSLWLQELHQLNRVDRYCIYDRPGYGFSDSSPSPYSLGVNSDMLSSVLSQKNIKGPFLVAGHGVGGLYARVFATRHISKVHSVLLVDAWSEDLLLNNPFKYAKNKDTKLPKYVHKLNRFEGFKLWLRGVISSANLVTYYDLIFHGYKSSERIYGRDLDTQGKYLRARLQEQVSASVLSYNDILLSKETLSDAKKEVSVISSKYPIRQSLNWGNWQRSLTKLSNNPRNEWIIAESGLYIWQYEDGKRSLQKLLLRMLGENDDNL